MKSSATLQAEAKRHMNEHRWREAMPILRDAILAAPDDAWNVMYLGSCFYELGRYSDALRCFERAGRLAPSNPTPLGLQADALHCLGDVEAARRLYKRALDLDPEDDLAIRNWKRFNQIEDAKHDRDS